MQVISQHSNVLKSSRFSILLVCVRARIAEYNPSLAFLLVATPFQDLSHLGPVIVGQGQSEYIQGFISQSVYTTTCLHYDL